MGAVTTIAIGLAGAGLSFYQASQLEAANTEANRAAAEEMKRLKKQAGVNVMDELSLNTEVFEKELENNLQVSADFIDAAQEVLSRIDDRQEIGTVVKAPRITIMEKISQISHYFQKFRRGTFNTLLTKNPSQVDVVVTFLAMLELIKRHLIIAKQSSLFGEIEIEASDIWNEDVEIEIEFGE